MSTEPSPSSETRPSDADSTSASSTPPTAIEARGRGDPWAALEEGDPRPVAACAPRQFEPTRRERLGNLFDDENAYCG